ncbi:MAG: N-formylglutamate amidohydrolase, partial [Burkholderiales bacterium]|nr:N-formylglutamate amidohydrolase [Burkholderiales bacterium]
LLFDSPHSGTSYPEDFGFACDFAALRKAEDTHVDDLYDFAPSLGATLITALFPRSYIDVNRRLADIDTSMLAQPWPHAVDLSPKSRCGIGLIWRLLDDQTPIYARKLTVEEVESRIERCYKPYWRALHRCAESLIASHGRLVHINCHSMPEEAGALSWVPRGTRFADIVLGDRDGTTCAPELTALLAELFRGEGFSVAINDPYKGVEIVKQLGRPEENRHSIQVEINRRLYMDERTRERSANYGALKAALERVMRGVADYARALSAGSAGGVLGRAPR